MKPGSRKLVVRLAGVGLAALLVLAASTLVISNRYPTTQTANLSFTLPADFSKVRGILVGTSATKEIIDRAGDNEYLEEKWTAVKPGLAGLEMNATLKVRSRDDYVGRPVVTLKQVVTITPDEVLSAIDLDEGAERLTGYEIVTHYIRNKEEKNTRVDLRLTQQILTTAPWFAHWIADRRVLDSAERQLVNQKRAIEELIADNGGDKPAAETQ